MIELIATPDQRVDRSQVGDVTRPHVLLLIDQFDRILGGAERVVLEIAGKLPDHGFRASILTLSLNRDSPALSQPTCPIYLLSLKHVCSFRTILASVNFSRFLKINHVQIVQTFFASSDLWGGFVAKTMSNSKLVWFLRDMGFQRTAKHRFSYQFMSRLPDAVFAVSEQVRKQCIQTDHVQPCRVFTIHNGVSPEKWNSPFRPRVDRDRCHITSVGNIRQVKGHDVFIEAAALVRDSFPEVTFSIVGEVLERDFYLALEDRLKALNLADRFRIISGCRDLPHHLGLSDIFVVASRNEGFPNVIIEAMAASLPVIATNVGGISEAVKHQVSGVIVPSEDVCALAKAMIRILSNPSVARSMGEKGREIAISEFTTAQMMNKISAVYRSLLAEL